MKLASYSIANNYVIVFKYHVAPNTPPTPTHHHSLPHTHTASGDYTSVAMDFTFSSTTISQTVSVDIENDEFFENTIESFTGNLQLIGTPERVTIQPAVATVNIEDEDGTLETCSI